MRKTIKEGGNQEFHHGSCSVTQVTLYTFRPIHLYLQVLIAKSHWSGPRPLVYNTHLMLDPHGDSWIPSWCPWGRLFFVSVFIWISPVLRNLLSSRKVNAFLISILSTHNYHGYSRSILLFSSIISPQPDFVQKLDSHTFRISLIFW